MGHLHHENCKMQKIRDIKQNCLLVAFQTQRVALFICACLSLHLSGISTVISIQQTHWGERADWLSMNKQFILNVNSAAGAVGQRVWMWTSLSRERGRWAPSAVSHQGKPFCRQNLRLPPPPPPPQRCPAFQLAPMHRLFELSALQLPLSAPVGSCRLVPLTDLHFQQTLIKVAGDWKRRRCVFNLVFHGIETFWP